jgi:hypothetical protein
MNRNTIAFLLTTALLGSTLAPPSWPTIVHRSFLRRRLRPFPPLLPDGKPLVRSR